VPARSRLSAVPALRARPSTHLTSHAARPLPPHPSGLACHASRHCSISSVGGAARTARAPSCALLSSWCRPELAFTSSLWLR
jgi:hypothetical protein